MTHEDELAAMRAQIDQAREGLREVAGACWAFYEGLTDAGFSEIQAMQLTIAWVSATASGAKSDD